MMMPFQLAVIPSSVLLADRHCSLEQRAFHSGVFRNYQAVLACHVHPSTPGVKTSYDKPSKEIKSKPDDRVSRGEMYLQQTEQSLLSLESSTKPTIFVSQGCSVVQC